MTRYKETYDQMVKDNKELFDSFQKVHDEYAMNEDKNQEEFNKIGKEVQKIIKIYEDRLCGHAEGSGYGKYSGGLAEKFQQEIKKHFTKIDNVGIMVSYTPSFELKKIL